MDLAQNHRAAERLRAEKDRILKLWEERVREEIPPAKETETPVLMDSMPVLLERLAVALDSETPEEALQEEKKTAAIEHGQQRALLQQYSLDQVIQEYQALREVMVKVVSKEQSIPPPIADLIYDFILAAIRNASSEFARLRDHEKLRAEAELREANRALDRRVKERVKDLRISEERFRKLVDAVKDYAIFTTDPGGYITSWNHGCHRMKGYEPDEAIGQHFSMLYPNEGRRRGEPMAHLRTASAEGRFRGEGVRVRKNGDHFLADVSITPMYEDDKLVGYAKVVQDLTERSLLMQERDISRGESNRLKVEAEFREQFVATLTHDLRSPLAVAKTNAELIARSPDKIERIPIWAKRIGEAVDRTDRMISEVLDASRLQAEKPAPVEFESCDLAEIARELVDELTPTYGNRFNLNLEGPPTGFWSREGLRRVLDNLISNALKYGDPGQPIAIGVRRVDDRVILSVHNHGTIIPIEEQQKLFTPFHRTNLALLSGQQGWGIGLTVVKSVVEAHHGMVKVESYPKEGTTFTVDLPVDARGQKEQR
jgi:PAS domain S-box-containing protein